MKRLHIIQYTDAHGRYLSEMPQDAEIRLKGLDRLASRIAEIKERGEDYLLIDNGDSIQGTPLVDLYPKNPDFQELAHPMNQAHLHLGVKAFVPGNHEFNFGLRALDELKNESHADWISANILKGGQPYYHPYKIYDFGGFKVGLLGLTTEYVPKWEHKGHLGELSFSNVLKEAKKYLPELRANCDYLIVSYHGGIAVDPENGKRYCTNDVENQALELWERHPEIDLLLLGHQHRKMLHQPKGRAILIQPSCHARCWAEVTLELKEAKLMTQVASIQEAERFQPQREMIEKFQPYLSLLRQILVEPLGTAAASFQVKDPMQEVWLKKHPFLQWCNQLLMERAGTDVAACSLLDLEVRGLPERVTKMDLLNAYFFQDSITLLEMKGSTLKAAMEQLASFFALPEGKRGTGYLFVNPEWAGIKIKSYNYDIFEGLEYAFDVTRPIGERLIELTYQGQPVADDQLIKVAMTTYRAGGGFFKMYEECRVIEQYDELITDLMAADLKKRGHLELTPIQNFRIEAGD